MPTSSRKKLSENRRGDVGIAPYTQTINSVILSAAKNLYCEFCFIVEILRSLTLSQNDKAGYLSLYDKLEFSEQT